MHFTMKYLVTLAALIGTTLSGPSESEPNTKVAAEKVDSAKELLCKQEKALQPVYQIVLVQCFVTNTKEEVVALTLKCLSGKSLAQTAASACEDDSITADYEKCIEEQTKNDTKLADELGEQITKIYECQQREYELLNDPLKAAKNPEEILSGIKDFLANHPEKAVTEALGLGGNLL